MDKREYQILGLLIAIATLIGANQILPRLLNVTYTVYLYPSIWLGISAYLWFQPRARHSGKLRLRPFLYLWAFLTAAMYVITYFASGIAFGMGKSPYSQALEPLAKNLLAFVGVPVLMEWVRSHIVNGVQPKRTVAASILLSLLYTLLTVNLSYLTMIQSLEDAASFVCSDLLPALMLNGFLCYLVYLGGAPMGMIYQAVTILPVYLLPVLPNLSWLASGIIGTLFPLFSAYILRGAYLKRIGQTKLRETKKENPLGWIAVLACCMALVWFFAGLFPVYPVTIMSGSMEPLVYPGDIVIIERANASEVKQGDIVQYWSNDFFIIHRVIGIDREKNETVYITKGDNNNVRDLKPVKAAQIRGRVIATVPKLGLLTYWFRSH